MRHGGPRSWQPSRVFLTSLGLAACALGSGAAARPQPPTHTRTRPVAVSTARPTLHGAKRAREARKTPLDAFHRALEGTRRSGSKTRILFYGDSHTASDCMTGRLRERLQADYGDGGPGFLILGKPWAYHHHGRAQLLESSGLRSRFIRKRPEADVVPLGLAGVALAGGDVEPVLVRLRIAGALVPTGPVLHEEIYFLRQPDGATLDVLLDGQPLGQLATAGKPEPGYFTFDVPDDGEHEIELRGPPEAPVTLLGLVAEREGAGVVLDTLGVPGARAQSHLYWEQRLFREQVRRRNPDLWVLAYGTNEGTDITQPIEQYASRLRQVIANLRSAAPQASCLLVGPTDFPERIKRRVYQVRERNLQINRVQRTVAAAAGCAFFDTLATMGGPLSILQWAKRDPPLAGRDMVHLTREGYEVLGDAIADAILPKAPGTARQ